MDTILQGITGVAWYILSQTKMTKSTSNTSKKFYGVFKGTMRISRNASFWNQVWPFSDTASMPKVFMLLRIRAGSGSGKRSTVTYYIIPRINKLLWQVYRHWFIRWTSFYTQGLWMEMVEEVSEQFWASKTEKLVSSKVLMHYTPSVPIKMADGSSPCDRASISNYVGPTVFPVYTERMALTTIRRQKEWANSGGGMPSMGDSGYHFEEPEGEATPRVASRPPWSEPDEICNKKLYLARSG